MRTTRACLVSFALFAWSCGNAKLVVDGGGEGPDALDDDSYGITYYVRADGGDPDQCDGRTDAAYPGSGAAQPCAWAHPFHALPPGGQPRIAGGDRVIIAAGDYRMGVGAPGAGACDPIGAWDCVTPAVPSGPDAAHPTRIVGAGYQDGCAEPPELWGAERARHIFDLSGTEHARVECLELTDHAGCVAFHSGGLACERDVTPYGDWAEDGLVAVDSSDVTLRNLDVHGFSHGGLFVGRLRDWTLEDVRIAGNGMVGWDGDVDGDDGNQGTMRFRRVTIEWNGCVETWPDGDPAGCWAQEAGGYGDGLGTGETGGDWIIEDSTISHNTSDGLDLLYHRLGGSIRIERVRAEGNAGNQIKTTGNAAIVNSVVIGNCGYFTDKPFTYLVDACRAVGNTLSLFADAGQQVELTNNTVYAEGDCLILSEGDCAGPSTVRSRNNIYVGDTDYLQPDDISCFYYTECSATQFEWDHDLVFRVKDGVCPPGEQNLCADPRFQDPDPEQFDGRLQSGSPARDSGLPVGDGIPAVDIDGNPRPAGAGTDRGAYESP